MLQVFSSGEAFYTACLMEESAIRLYSRALMLLENMNRTQEPLYALMTELRSQEREHLQRFRTLGENDVSEDRKALLSVQAEELLFEGGLMGAVRAGLLETPEALLSFAKKAEKLSAEHYQAFAEAVKDESARQALLTIAHQEWLHLEDLSKLEESL